MVENMVYRDIKAILEITENPVEKLEILMDFGKKLEQIPDGADCTEIVGCSSFVQICRKDNKFYATADSAIVRGIVAVLLSMVDGMSVQNIKNLNTVVDILKSSFQYSIIVIIRESPPS